MIGGGDQSVRITFPEENIDAEREATILRPLLEDDALARDQKPDDESLWSFPGFFPGVQCGITRVFDNDPREALRGQNGE